MAAAVSVEPLSGGANSAMSGTSCSLLRLAADISAELCGHELELELMDLRHASHGDGNDTHGSMTTTDEQHASFSTNSICCLQLLTGRRSFLLPDEMAEMVIASSRALPDGSANKKCSSLEFPTSIFFADSALLWIRSSTRYCVKTLMLLHQYRSSALSNMNAALTGDSNAADFAANFARVFMRMDKMRPDKSFLIGDSLTVVDVTVAMLLLGTYLELVAAGLLPLESHVQRQPFFQRCVTIVQDINEKMGSIDRRRSTSAAASLIHSALLASDMSSSETQTPTAAATAAAHAALPAGDLSPAAISFHEPNGGNVIIVSTAPPPTAAPATPTLLLPKSNIGRPNADSSADFLVVALSMLYFVMVGIESGTVPSALDTMQAQLGSSTTEITTALQMTEVGKILAAPLVAHFALGRKRKFRIILAACVIWTVGAVLVCTSRSVFAVGGGTMTYGFGFGAC